MLSLLKKRESRAQRTSFLGMAPKFSGAISTTRNLDSLLYNTKEVLVIDSIIGGDVLLNEDATLSNFKQKIQDYKIAHFATHAICNDSFPLRSQIMFADSSISVQDIYHLNQDLDLAVLSVCDAGAGQLKKGEGIISLARAFIQSGCASIITSLWPVNDKQTPQLMEYFYTNLKEGQAKNLALSTAQRTYLTTISEDSYAHPFYWANFIQIGDPVAIFQDSFFDRYAWHLFGLAFLSLMVVLLLSWWLHKLL